MGPNKVKVIVTLQPIVSRPVRLGVRRPSGTCDQFLFLLEIFFRQLCVCYTVAPSLTRGQVCNLLYNCFWSLPEQSLLGQSPAKLMAIFYCLIWDCVPYSSLLTIRRDYCGGIVTRLHMGCGPTEVKVTL
jgi:hypothetical protein